MRSSFDPSKMRSAPEGYIPGISRGSQGFITRSDIGPMMTDVSMGLNVARAQAAAQQRASRENSEAQGLQFNESRFDPWSGMQGGNLFKIVDYDEEDKEADEIYASVDKYLEGKRGQKRELKVKKEMEDLRKKNPTTRDKMKDAVKDLTKMGYEDWMKIPEIGDYKFKRSKRSEKFTPIPDSLIADRLEKAKLGTYDQSSSESARVNKQQQDGQKSTIPSSLNVLGQARGRVLGIELDRASKTVSNQSVINKNGYLTALSQLPINTSDQIVDLKRAKLLMKSMINSKPNIARNWVGAARVEELDGKVNKARAILANAIDYCPESEDIWYEAARLEKVDTAKAILSRGIKNCPTSVKLWMAAFKLEVDKLKKKEILRKSLKFIPQSEKIWKNLIDLSENDEEATELLKHAVECLPDNLQIRLAYAKLLDYENAKQELNKANRHFHLTEKSIWINAAKLEEANSNADKCPLIIKKALKKIIKKKKMIKREEWLIEAQECEIGGSLETAKAIIYNLMVFDQKEEAYKKQWLEDASLFIQRGRIDCARWVYTYACELEKRSTDLWFAAMEFERVHGDEKAYLGILTRAIEFNQENQDFWLKAAKIYIQKGDEKGAKKILDEAIQTNPEKHTLYIAKSDVEKECKNFNAARAVLRDSRKKLNHKEIWRRNIKLELELGDSQAALKVALKALKNFPQDAPILCDLADVYTELRKFKEAKSIFGSVIKSKKLKKFVRAWISLMKLVEKENGVQKARAIFEKAKGTFDKIPEEIWYEFMKMEERAGTDIASMLELALRQYPKNGEFWSMAIEKEPLDKRMAKSVIALEHSDSNCDIINSIALIQWLKKSFEKARSWFERSVSLNSKKGDTWGYYVLLLRETEDTEEAQAVIQRCIKSEPDEGRYWRNIAGKPLNWDLNTQEILEKVIVDLKYHITKIKILKY